MHNGAADRLRKLKDLLAIEREEDHRLYQEQFLRATPDQRRQNGVTWYPVKINDEEIGSGELVHLTVERTTHQDLPHQFSSGKNVNLFSNRGDEELHLAGTIRQVSGNIMRIVMHTEELPDWCYDGKLGVNVAFDDYTYEVMNDALEEIIRPKNKRLAELRDIIEGDIRPAVSKPGVKINAPLNRSQLDAVTLVAGAEDVAVIHGPPGTGKTTTLVEAIRMTLVDEKQVLVCAPTNTAVDLLVEKLRAAGVDVLRLGHPARISDSLTGTSLDGRVSASPYYKDVKRLRKQAEEYFRMAGKYKRVLGREDIHQRGQFYAEAKKCIREAMQIEDYITDELFATAQAICCTPVTSRHKGMRSKRFRTLFFDEASQALEPMVWVPLLKCSRLVLAGDHFQLPPVIKSFKARQGGLETTMLDRCVELPGVVALLKRQYRMNALIMGFSNSYFYGNQLEADESVVSHTLNDAGLQGEVIEFVDTAGCGLEEIQNPESLSYSNPGEGRVLIRHLKSLVESGQLQPALNTLGIICPYKEQREWFDANFESEMELPGFRKPEIKTIDGFQGEERDVIYISLVRSNQQQEIGFLSDLRRMNVAITRARKKLVVIGDSATVGSHPFYRSFLEYCEQNGLYRSGWEFMD